MKESVFTFSKDVRSELLVRFKVILCNIFIFEEELFLGTTSMTASNGCLVSVEYKTCVVEARTTNILS